MLAAMVIAYIWGENTVVVPGFGPQGAAFLMATLLLPTPVVAGALACLGSDEMESRELGAVRRLPWWDVGLVTGWLLVLPVALVLAIGDASKVPPEAMTGALWWTALGVAAAVFLGRRLAWSIPVVTTVALVLFGLDGDRPLWWAIPFHAVTPAKVALAVLVYLVAGRWLYMVLAAPPWTVDGSLGSRSAALNIDRKGGRLHRASPLFLVFTPPLDVRSDFRLREHRGPEHGHRGDDDQCHDHARPWNIDRERLDDRISGSELNVLCRKDCGGETNADHDSQRRPQDRHHGRLAQAQPATYARRGADHSQRHQVPTGTRPRPAPLPRRWPPTPENR